MFFVLAAKLPEIKSHIKPCTAVQGKSARFEVEIDGQPPPEISWYVNTGGP